MTGLSIKDSQSPNFGPNGPFPLANVKMYVFFPIPDENSQFDQAYLVQENFTVLSLLTISMHKQNLVKFCPFPLKIFSCYEILKSLITLLQISKK